MSQAQKAAEDLGRYLASLRPAVETLAEEVRRIFQHVREQVEPARRRPDPQAWTRFAAGPQTQPRAHHRGRPAPHPLAAPRPVRRRGARPRDRHTPRRTGIRTLRGCGR